MRIRLLALLSALVFLFPYAHAQTGYINVFANKLTDANGNPANATICAQATNSSGVPINVRPSSGGTTTISQVCATVTNGVWSMKLPDTSLSQPKNACFAFTATDNTSGAPLVGNGFSCVQPTSVTNAWCLSGSCDFDNLPPNLASLVVVQQGPQGPVGPAGCTVGGTCSGLGDLAFQNAATPPALGTATTANSVFASYMHVAGTAAGNVRTTMDWNHIVNGVDVGLFQMGTDLPQNGTKNFYLYDVTTGREPFIVLPSDTVTIPVGGLAVGAQSDPGLGNVVATGTITGATNTTFGGERSGLSADGTMSATDASNEIWGTDFHGSNCTSKFDEAQFISCSGGFARNNGGGAANLEQAMIHPRSNHLGVCVANIGYGQGATSDFVGWNTQTAGALPTGDTQRFGIKLNYGLYFYDGVASTPINQQLFAYNGLPGGRYDVCVFKPGDGHVYISMVVRTPAVYGLSFVVNDSEPSVTMNNAEVGLYNSGDFISSFAFASDNSSAASVWNIPHMDGIQNATIQWTLQDSTSPSNQSVVAWMPPSYRNGRANPHVLLAHEYGGGVASAYNPYAYGGATVTQTLMSAGYTVIDGQNTYTNCYGSPTCTQDLATEEAIAQSVFSLAPQPYLMASSMGGLQALSAVAEGTIRPRAFYGFDVNTNLATDVGSDFGAANGDVTAAFGCNSAATCQTAEVGYDPQIAAGGSAGTSALGITGAQQLGNLLAVPMMLTSSSSDTTVPEASNTLLFQATLNSHGGQVQQREHAGGHLAGSATFCGACIVAFFGQHQ